MMACANLNRFNRVRVRRLLTDRGQPIVAYPFGHVLIR